MGAWRQSTARAWTIPPCDPRSEAGRPERRRGAARAAARAPALGLGAAELRARPRRVARRGGRAARRLRGRDGRRAARARGRRCRRRRRAARARGRPRARAAASHARLTTRGETDFVRRHPFELVHEILAMRRQLDGPVAEPAVAAPASARARSSRATPSPCTPCSTRRIVRGTAGTSRSHTTTGSAG